MKTPIFRKTPILPLAQKGLRKMKIDFFRFWRFLSVFKNPALFSSDKRDFLKLKTPKKSEKQDWVE